MLAAPGRISSPAIAELNGERFWTLVGEYEVAHLAAFMSIDDMDPETAKELESTMKGDHDFVDYGHREIFTIEN